MTDGAYAFPVSFAQRRLWLLQQIEPSSAAYHLAGAVELRGALSVEALAQAFATVVARHEALRTCFVERDGIPVQIVAEHLNVPMPVTDLDEAREDPGRLQRMMAAEVEQPFDLTQAPCLRTRLFRLAPGRHVLLIVVHHLLADGWSMGVMARELSACYDAGLQAAQPDLPSLAIQYGDFAVWQQDYLTGGRLGADLAYWTHQLAGPIPPLDLPTDRPRSAVERYRGDRLTFALAPGIADGILRVSREEGVTVFMVALAAFQVLLMRYTGQQDICVGTPVAGRNRQELEPLVGFFVNTLVLRTDLSGNPTVREVLGRVRETALGAYAHQDLPFEKLVEALRLPHDPSRNPLFQVMLAFQPPQVVPLRLRGLEVTPVDLERRASQFDLTLFLQEQPAGIAGWVEYSTDLFDRATIERLARHWCALLEGMVVAPGRRLSELPLLNDAERRQVLVEWNATAREYGGAARLHRLIERQATLASQSVALEFEGRELTYAALNRRANQLARVLRRRGVGPDVLVGVFAERSFEMVMALLAVLKAGGAYVPLDPSYPAERLAHMLEDARAPLVLAQPHLESRLPAQLAETLLLDSSWEAYGGEAGEDLEDVGTPLDLAYVIFTSGSTGRPKGAMNTHRGIYNRLLWMQEEYGLTGNDRVLQKTPFSFDVSVWEFFWPLLTGARLVIARPEGHRDTAYLVRLVRDSKITTLHFVPSMLRVLLEEQRVEACGSLRRVICSGEALPRELQEHFFARLPGVELHNLYGPTEAAVDVTYWACRQGDDRLTVPIGRPVANTQIYVLDGRMQPVPVGVAGELVIGGVQVGRGYVGRDDLTAERFVPDPFSNAPGARLYKTGDLARHLADGVVEYLGRLDYQVKIRGQRIELGEIEAMLNKHVGVGQSVVMAREDTPGDQRLVAYVVARQPVPSTAELEEHLSRELPGYMVPTAFVFVGALPLTSSGKVDRRSLPPPDADDQRAQAIDLPRTPTERALADIWREVLRIEHVGARDNFFSLGGHSLLATRITSRVQKRLGVRLPLNAFFRTPTIEALAQIVDEATATRRAAVGTDLEEFIL